MGSILQELYFGNVSPWERKRVNDPKYAELTKKYDDIEMHFKVLLSPEEYAKLEEMQNLRAQADIFEEVQLFEYAFCTGALLMIDVFGHRRQS